MKLARRGLEELARMLLENGAQPSAEDNYGRTPADLATAFLHLPIVAMLKADAEPKT
jgi:ankyrin repeat protein